ncbi:MAG: hypothetical protein QM796_05660 [Chthoniobacteraceae bacterium]
MEKNPAGARAKAPSTSGKRRLLSFVIFAGSIVGGLMFAFITFPTAEPTHLPSQPLPASPSAIVQPASASPTPSSTVAAQAADDFINDFSAISQSATPTPGIAPASPSPADDSPVTAYVRPLLAPNGRVWPTAPSYLPGYDVQAQGGLSSVVVDNTQNDSDLFVKLVSLDGDEPTAVRYSYIPAGGQFTFESVATGRYDLRYQDLTHGGYSKTGEFTLEETKSDDGGTNYSDIHLSLSTLANGNQQMQTISPSEF